MINNKQKLICLIGLLLFLSGCWDDNEPERMLYIHGVGIDYHDEKYQIYAQIINFPNIAKTEDPKGEPEQVEVGHASGETIEEAIFELYDTVDQRILWGHLSFIIFHENVLKNKRLNSVIDNFLRYAETKYQMWLYSTNDSVKDLLLAVPIVSKSVLLSKLGDPLNTYSQDSFIEPITLRSFIIGLDEPNFEIAIPQVQVTHNWESVKEKTHITEYTGATVISHHQLKGNFIGENAYGLRWMNNKTKRSSISFYLDKENKNGKTSVVLENINVTIEPIIQNDQVLFDISVSMQATVNALTTKTTENKLKEGIKEVVKEDIFRTYHEALEQNIDIYRLSEHIYRKEVQTWKKIEKNGKIPLTENSIRTLDVDVKKIKSGRKSLTDTLK